MTQQYVGPLTMVFMFRAFMNVFTFAMSEPAAVKPGLTEESREGWQPKFIMYHASPASNVQEILRIGLRPSPPPHQESPWAPDKPVVYMSSDVSTVEDYARQAYEVMKSPERRWAIFKIEYDEFPEEIHPDLLWGLPGTYYTFLPIPPDHLTLVRYYTATN